MAGTPHSAASWLRRTWGDGSGPLVARTFHRLLGCTFLVAFISLGVQVDELIASNGLLPIAPFLDGLRSRGDVGFLQFPTFFWWRADDALVLNGVWIGALLALAAVLGWQPRFCMGLCTAIYLSYAVACRSFLAFQWDNLLLECGMLAVFLPRHRRAGWIHFLFRVLLFKLYFESGVAKWQSHLHDWHDGSAMTYYYETAPIPTWISWHAHHLPEWWHHLESRAAMALELGGAVLVFGPRLARRFAFLAFSGFQLIDIATANYGFFCYQALVLHIFLLGDSDLSLIGRWLHLPAPRSEIRRRPLALRLLELPLALLITSAYLAISLGEGLTRFAEFPEVEQEVRTFRPYYAPFRLVHNYHLFGHITRTRYEPQFETLEVGKGKKWREHDLHFKPGDPARPPPFVAPHQPRVDFRLWFYGLSYRRRTPPYVRAIIDRLCHRPESVQDLFVDTLPSHPMAARVALWDYHFTTPEERAASGAWWTRTRLGQGRTLRCN